jgi:hypothetical protein
LTRSPRRCSKGIIENAREPHRSALSLFGEALRGGVVLALWGLFVEYLTFAAAVFLALLLFATRVPVGWLDRTFGWRLRERAVDLLARASPG